MSEQPAVLISKKAIVRLQIDGQFSGAVVMDPKHSDAVMRSFLEGSKGQHADNQKEKADRPTPAPLG